MRADKFFADRFGSRTKAKDALERGLILRNGRPLEPKSDVSEGEPFVFLDARETFVSQGGYKLARGLDRFGFSVRGKAFADLGASTGGFTDCLLQRGARRVYCVDVGESLLDPSLAADPRVVKMDRTNARYLSASDFAEPLDGVTADLSFISLSLVLPAVARMLGAGGCAFVLFKPQFECEGRGLGKSGILPRSAHPPLLRKFYALCAEAGLSPKGIVNAPLREKKNVEYVAYLERDGEAEPLSLWLSQAQKILENPV